MSTYQTGILADVPTEARYLTFSLRNEANPKSTLQALAKLADGEHLIIGLGRELIKQLGSDLPSLPNFPASSDHGVEIPATPAELWCWLRGDNRGDLVLKTTALRTLLDSDFECLDVVDAFRHGSGRDLTGYEDGTENPEGEEAREAAFDENGASFVAVQKWVHNFPKFHAMSQQEQDLSIGRHISDNEEIEDAPVSAHVKRTEQESFSPEAIVLRRSMPWADAQQEGLNFVAFGKDFTAFEAQLNRMVGGEDGITDAIFQFTTPVTGNYFWCPPVKNGTLELQTIGL